MDMNWYIITTRSECSATGHTHYDDMTIKAWSLQHAQIEAEKEINILAKNGEVEIVGVLTVDQWLEEHKAFWQVPKKEQYKQKKQEQKKQEPEDLKFDER